jgi:hypothetical protein
MVLCMVQYGNYAIKAYDVMIKYFMVLYSVAQFSIVLYVQYGIWYGMMYGMVIRTVGILSLWYGT